MRVRRQPCLAVFRDPVLVDAPLEGRDELVPVLLDHEADQLLASAEAEGGGEGEARQPRPRARSRGAVRTWVT